MTMSVLEMDGPVLFFGGSYSNLEATVALQEEAPRLGIRPSNIVCTGDVVASCADPVATVATIRDWGVHVVMSNCEESLCWSKDDCGCGFEEGTACAALSGDWNSYSNRLLGEDDRKWMRSLPRRLDITIAGRRLAVIHGSVDTINSFVFASTPWADKEHQIEMSGCDGVVGGHSGIPFTHAACGKLWHNSGALGMPANDGTSRGWYSLFTPTSSGIAVRLLSLDYDAGSASRKMRDRGLPSGYADALESGLWPSCDVLPAEELARRGQVIAPTTLFWS
ncbi:MAG: metallophosphoesterase family protein [Reyranella sp.]|nr:metallophosphoesterase family protein [Reyranella sp.]MBL6650245.1 metallophosphoesterase family protein [Reyranella sp.]